MYIDILVQNPSDLKTLTSKEFDFTQVGYFQVEVEEGECDILEIPYLEAAFSNSNTKLIFLAIEGSTAVGAICVEYCENGWDFGPCKWSMMSIGVNENFRKKGYSNLMIKSMFETMDSLGLSGLSQSSYTEKGAATIKKTFNHYSKLFPSVGFLDSEKVF
jgi:hypothetical protein